MSPSTTASADVGAEFQLVLDVLRREAVAAGGGGEVLHAVDHHQVPVLVEVAGVAGVQPAVAQVGVLRHAEVAGEHVGMPRRRSRRGRCASGWSMRVSIRSLKATPTVSWFTSSGAVDGVGAERLGLAVELAQRHAHGLEEAEGVGTQRRAAGRRRAQPGEAEPVAQRPEQQRVAPARSGARASAHRGPSASRGRTCRA